MQTSEPRQDGATRPAAAATHNFQRQSPSHAAGDEHSADGPDALSRVGVQHSRSSTLPLIHAAKLGEHVFAFAAAQVAQGAEDLGVIVYLVCRAPGDSGFPGCSRRRRSAAAGGARRRSWAFMHPRTRHEWRSRARTARRSAGGTARRTRPMWGATGRAAAAASFATAGRFSLARGAGCSLMHAPSVAMATTRPPQPARRRRPGHPTHTPGTLDPRCDSWGGLRPWAHRGPGAPGTAAGHPRERVPAASRRAVYRPPIAHLASRLAPCSLERGRFGVGRDHARELARRAPAQRTCSSARADPGKRSSASATRSFSHVARGE